jgi:anti-sigma factor ChrR (cupin superfamily)
VLLVMLDQFDPTDDADTRIDTNTTDWFPGEDNIRVMPLHYFETEMVALYKWPAGTKAEPHQHFGGEEVFVLSGAMLDEYGRYPAGTWLRNPHNSEHCPYVEEDTIIWIKTGHMLP